MVMDDRRRLVLQRIIAAAVAAATPISFLRAATRKSTGAIPTKTIQELADGRKIEIISKGDALIGRVIDAQGRVIGTTPSGKLKLKSGKTITFDKSGRMTQGELSERSFVLFCDDPPAPCPPK
jgi:hypothetical protein